MYEIEVCPVKRLYDIAVDGDMDEVSAIVISSYDIEMDKLNGFQSVLPLNFADTTDSARGDAFNMKMAEQVAAFVKGLPARTDTLFVCCDRGESRSAAVAASVMRHNGKDENEIWNDPSYHPNPLVYRLVCRAFGIKLRRFEVFCKVRRNKKALSQRIKQLKK